MPASPAWPPPGRSAGPRSRSPSSTSTTTSHGRIPVGPALQLAGHPEVFVAGDLAEIPAGAEALPMLAQVGIQSGRHAGRSIAAQVSGHQARPFRYRDLGTMATIGRNNAIAQIGPLRLSGFAGWLAWLLVHIVRTAGLQTRASVVIRWIAGYLFANRPVRLITGPQRESAPARQERGIE